MASSGICSVNGCIKPIRSRSLCNAHYQKLLTYGEVVGRDNAAKGQPQRFIKEILTSDPSDECIIWPYGRVPRGYGMVTWKGKQQNAHTVVCREAHGEPPSPHDEAAHTCGVTSCCNPLHIRWDTHQGNVADKLVHGTHNRGERHNMVKLTETDVRLIRNKMSGTTSVADIAAHFGVTKEAIRMIIKRKTWAWLDDGD
ncbi:HNH endonuclease [Agrobacterium sp.]|uniref:HNH endonuclease n=1 Tax=Agrobacterium sp. TaxID=361 RepID=UPI0025C537AE|nr:HNH endonuclease [Agrobacterium sp.]MCD4661809.1 hypothetical protein [Agrobacterium sp.]